MRAISAAELLEVWERGSPRTLAERAVELLALASLETSRESLLALSLGQRDTALLQLRERLFGSRMVAVVMCPDCGERLDLTFDTREIRAEREPDEATDESAEVLVSNGGYELRLRAANTGDAVEISNYAQADGIGDDPDFARRLLLTRCLMSADHAGMVVEADQIPAEVADAAVQRMADADPMADIQLAMTCPSCTREWSAALDVVSFLWNEIEVWAWQLLNEVHTLASAYGWPEREIVAMSANRRQCYLQMVWA